MTSITTTTRMRLKSAGTESTLNGVSAVCVHEITIPRPVVEMSVHLLAILDPLEVKEIDELTIADLEKIRRFSRQTVEVLDSGFRTTFTQDITLEVILNR